MGKNIAIIAVILLVIIGGAVVYANRDSLFGKSSPSPSPSPSSSMSHTPTNSPSSSPSSTQQATNSVTIKNFAFSPSAITVKKGTVVTWTNQDSATHTVTETDGKDGPKSGNLAAGNSYSFTFNTVGTFQYDCSIHTSMTGTVTVTE